MVYLMDLERTIGSGMATYWKANKHGYTRILSEAGLFDIKEATEIVVNDIDSKTILISKRVVDNIQGA